MTIKVRLIGSVLLIFFILVGMFATTWIATSDQRDDSLVINISGRQRMLSQKLAKEMLTFGASRDEALKDQIQSTVRVFETSLHALSESGPVPLTLNPDGDMGELPKPSEVVHAQLLKVEEKWSGLKALIEQGVASGEPDVAKITSESGEVLKAMNVAVGMLQTESEQKITTLLVLQLVGVSFGIVIVLIVLFSLQTKLTTPLKNLQLFAGDIAKGNLSAKIAGEYSEELLLLKDAIVTMVENLKKNMDEVAIKGKEAEKNAAAAQRAVEEANAQQTQVKELLSTMSRAATKASQISRDVATSVTELASQVDEVNRGTDVQRDRMTETATAMEEMNATVLEVARNASNAAESASRARDNAQTGANGVRAAVTSIDAIRVQILDLNSSMAELGKQAENIGKIMNVVTDIADQTNLLALNAAIEAARAGDAGRGFAVVADEVRKLAEKTMQATKEVGDAVHMIQTQARENIRAVEKSVQDIVKSTEAATESGQFMAEIVAIVGETAGQVESIAAASEEQSAASEEINQAVNDVTQIASETAQGMNRAAEALDAMAAMAADLDAVIRDMLGDTSSPAMHVERPAATPKAKSQNSSKDAPAIGKKLSNRSGLKAADPKGIMQWSDDLSVNIREIDEQHIRLINLINSLQTAMRSGKGKSAVAKVLDELKDYTVFHFSNEEAMFEEHRYAGEVNHLAAHRSFVDKIVSFEEQILSGKSTVTMEVMNFLKDWLVKHIKGVDQKYSAFFNDKGIY